MSHRNNLKFILSITIAILVCSGSLWAEIDISDYFKRWEKPRTTEDSLMNLGFRSLNADTSWNRFREALNHNPTGLACKELGKIAYARGLYKQARILLELHADIDDETRFWLGQCLIILSEYDSAKVALEGISTPPYLGFSYVALGDVFSLLGDEEVAGHFYEYVEDDEDLSGLVKGKQTSSTVPAPQAATRKPGDWKGWVIQFGAFQNRENAADLKVMIEKEGFNIKIVEKSIGSQKYYLVWAGVWNSMDEAEERATAMSDYYAYRILEIE
ncbi:SPOR domain-containing protein [bacterium]|nr:SPOR domain-containing protein [bacterium]